jgi:hypothetical protein
MGVVVARFNYSGESKEVPVIVNNDRLASIDSLVKGEAVEHRGISVVGPFPYVGGDISLFAGLFRARTGDLATAFFGVMNELAGIFSITQLSSYLTVAGTIGRSVKQLMGSKEVEMRLGLETTLSVHGEPLLRPGFFVLLNQEESAIEAELWVKNGLLYRGADAASAQRISNVDYCLVELRCFSERNDHENLPFHAIWKKLEEGIWAGQSSDDPEKAAKVAKLKFGELMQGIVASPDLTKQQKIQLMKVYKFDYDRAFEMASPDNAVRSGNGSKGAAGFFGKKALAQSMQALAQHTKFASTRKALATLLQHAEQLNQATRYSDRLSENDIKEQLTVLAQIEAAASEGQGMPGHLNELDPEAFASALFVALLDPARHKAAGA